MNRVASKWRSSTLALLLVLCAACGTQEEPRTEGALAPGQREASLSVDTGSMSVTRYAFSTTLLTNGKVLVVGGSGDATLASAEIYDPGTGTFSAAASMPNSRRSHRAVRLGDGQVLIIGGMGSISSDYPTLVRRYDPATNTWSTAGSLTTGRTSHTVTLLADGRVLATGGSASNYSGLASCELFNPATGTWTSAAPLSVARVGHSATLLPSGKVLVVGGNAAASAELYDPATNTWSATSAPLRARRFHEAFLLQDGRVLVAAGEDPGTFELPTSTEIYDPATGSWTPAGALSQARKQQAGVLLSSGKALLFGGYASNYLDSIERFDPATGTWSTVSPLLRPRGNHGTALLSGDKVLLVGGLSTSPMGGSAELYMEENTCIPTTCAESGKDCGTLSDGCGGTLICGGCASGQYCSDDNVCTVGSNGNAHYDALLQAPRCTENGALCDSIGLLVGRSGLGPEPHAPNTLAGSSCSDGNLGTFHVYASLDRLKMSTLDGTPLAPGKQVRIEATVWANSTSNKLELYLTTNVNAPSWTYITTLTPSGTGAQTLSTTYTLPSSATARYALRGAFRSDGQTGPCSSGYYNDHEDLVFPVSSVSGDLPPTVALTAPAANAQVQGTVLITADATDDEGIARVEFYLDGQLLGTDTRAPYTYSWATQNSANGQRQLQAKAYDSIGQEAVSSRQVQVLNHNPVPTSAILMPSSGQWTADLLSIQARGSDDTGVTLLEVYVDGTVIHSSTSSFVNFSWSTSGLSEGSHTMFSRAYDAAGQMGESALVYFFVDRTAPVATITSPQSGSTVQGVVTVTVDATDELGINTADVVLVGRNTTIAPSNNSSPFLFTWHTQSYANGTYTLQARARDWAGNQGLSTQVQITVANSTQPSGGATYDSTRKAPGCTQAGVASCDSGSLLVGRATLGPESNAPNTLYSSCQDGTAGSFHADESLDRLKVSTLDGTALAAGKTVRIEATVWAWSASGSDVLDLYYAADANSPSWAYLTTLTPSASGQQVLSTIYTLPGGALQAVRGVFRYGGSPGSCVTGSYNDHDDLFFAVQ
ncbi:Ig-like domain-containing protein [Myxococcus sp. NMCA1]|uniref:Ig-like domain-containing protein n=1 Tax=Myxococcus sp. NMCA1 TaxID=2996785 RepID=UPI00228555C4|nr:Ig-like domain-containing protein [Myxococcus sp. NMCA1]WAM23992.1 Ig-like domain-containing protein [Myxococcus sp. NMCA1]